MSDLENAGAANAESLAADIGCMTEDGFARLARVKVETAQAWRRRNQSPPFVRFGNQILYPREAVAAWLTARIKEPSRAASAKDLL